MLKHTNTVVIIQTFTDSMKNKMWEPDLNCVEQKHLFRGVLLSMLWFLIIFT